MYMHIRYNINLPGDVHITNYQRAFGKRQTYGFILILSSGIAQILEKSHCFRQKESTMSKTQFIWKQIKISWQGPVP